MTSIFETKVNDTKYIGIVFAAEWFGDAIIHTNLLIYPLDYVVCQWHDYHDGEKSNLEGKITIAICREKEHAILIYNSRISKEESDNFSYVIYDTIKKTFLNKAESFTSYLGNAKIFSNKYDAESSLEYYIKINKYTNNKDTILNLEVHPVRIVIVNT
jgi:hypothetical protein